ncbi:MAG: hypothetical protein HRU09_11440 [Oligoflexales bacterium]|nr:hypothetical protein [Oligoflexales bacterium]
MECQQNYTNSLVDLKKFTQSSQMPVFLGSIESYEDEEDEEDSAEIVPLDEELNQVGLDLEDDEDQDELPNGFSNVSDSEMDDYSQDDN